MASCAVPGGVVSGSQGETERLEVRPLDSQLAGGCDIFVRLGLDFRDCSSWVSELFGSVSGIFLEYSKYFRVNASFLVTIS